RDAGPARPRYRGKARAGREDGYQGSAQEVRDGGHGQRRLPVRGDRRYRRPHAARREISQSLHRDRYGGDAVGHRDRALDPRRAPRPRQVSLGLRSGWLLAGKSRIELKTSTLVVPAKAGTRGHRWVELPGRGSWVPHTRFGGSRDDP